MKLEIKKKLITLAVAVLFAVGVKQAHAVNYTDVHLDVTVSLPLNISVVGVSTVTFGAIGLNVSTVGANGVVLRNDSVGLSVTYLLAGNPTTDAAGIIDWPWGAAPGTVNTFAVRAKFSATGPSLTAFSDTNDVVTVKSGAYPGGFRKSDGTVFASTGYTGMTVPPLGERLLWVKFISAVTANKNFGRRTLFMSVVAEMN